jgi:2-keto-4-pentenoate hydratase
MTPEAVERAATLLVGARRARRPIDHLPDDARPRDLEDAYAVRDRIGELLAEPVAGWFCGLTNPEVQRQLGIDRPYCSRIMRSNVVPSPARLDASEWPPLVLEVEFAFRIGRDIPSGASRETVRDAVDAMYPAIEVVAGWLRDWPHQDVWSVIADNGTDGPLVLGEPVADWRDLDLIGLSTTLAVNGEVVRDGSGANVGDPFGALVWLAGEAPGGLKAGMVCNTGTTTAMYHASPGDRALADFGPLGTTQLEITP